MSWEYFEYDISTECACGKGNVIRHILSESDDWGRSYSQYTGEKIDCPECRKSIISVMLNVKNLTEHF